MSSFKIIFLSILITVSSFAQNKTTATQILVPYKVADHFGIATQEGKMLVQPTFDHIVLGDIPNFFIGFNYTSYNAYKTALIVNDKVLLKDQNYFGYYPTNDVIIAVARAQGKGSGYYSFAPEAMDVYDFNGKKVSDETYKYASVLGDFDKDNKLSQELIYLIHKDETYSVVLFDKKTSTFTTTFINKAKDIEFVDLYMVYHLKETTIKYVNANNQGHELKIGLKDQKFVKTFEGTFKVEPQRNDYDIYNDVVAVPDFDREMIPAPKVTASEITMDVIEFRKDRDSYKPSTLFIKTKQLDPTYSKLVFDGTKRGLYLTKKEQFIIESKYDAIYQADFKGIHANGYILLNDDVYTIKMYNFGGKEYAISGTFQYMPFVSFAEYTNPNTHIISLYDQAGNFLYYANQDGTVFYKEK
ncbi:hypothetical protein M0G43_11390 [Subsaxibacter sp. CAU 1640]|uniref:hypothetical protein n=1 Tax=Subsaxibacter sp. CAU 1640 TaxID=2933271 RepID=UPI00200314E9|nr:hypothetical protein [Subsaxibacter sp. CAU 1640]MCK7591180.1 hypothetical protein [Subsaxibacter sp. CAU 1640]